VIKLEIKRPSANGLKGGEVGRKQKKYQLPSWQSRLQALPSTNTTEINPGHWISEGEVEIVPCQ
jgi:hypothetical protein